MISTRIIRFGIAAMISSGCVLTVSCGAQRPETQTPTTEISTDQAGVNEETNTQNSVPDENNNQQIQQDENITTNAEDNPEADINDTVEDNKPIVFPVPNEADGAELLQFENITFEAKTTPIPNIATIIRSAQKNKDASSMFIAHMMYRDKIGDITYYNKGKKQETELSEKELHREMIRWRDASFDANYELAILATGPSIQYETSPFYSNDNEFKNGMNWLIEAAAHGYGNAEYILGLVYFNGIGTKSNKEKGFELLVRAAAHGVINAYYAVAMIYELGLNGKANTEKSLYWLNKAAHFGSKDAAFILAMKYLDGIDVPKDKTKALEIAKLDPTYHAWIKLIDEGFYHKFCIYRFDESAIAWSAEEYGVCADDVEIVHKNDAGIDEDKDDYTLDEIAESSLNYRIDYRVAAKWLKKVATFDRDNAYILRAKTHHITGCRGGLDGDEYGDIILYPVDFYNGNDYDNHPVLFQKLIIAITDYRADSSKLIKTLEGTAESGDRVSIELLGQLYDQSGYDSEYRDISRYLGIKVNHLKAFEYYEKLFNIDEENCKKSQKAKCQPDDNHVVDISRKLAEQYEKNGDYKAAYEWYEKAYQFSIRTMEYENAIYSAKLIAQISYKNNHHDVGKQWNQKIIKLYEDQYNALNQMNDKDTISKEVFIASELGRLYHKIGDDNMAVAWYEKALTMSHRYGKLISYYIDIEQAVKRHDDILIELAKIYDSDTSTVYDSSKAVKIYKEALVNNKASSNHLYQAAIRLCEISYHSTQNSDQLLAVASCKVASELYHKEVANAMARSETTPFNDKEIQLIQTVVEGLPKLDLLNEVENQIRAEKDKDPNNFFVISNLLAYCKKVMDDDPEGGPQCSRVDSVYSESKDKAITAITALNLASGTLNLDIIENTYYYLAIYKGKDHLYREKLRKESAVYNAFFDGEYSSYYMDMNDYDAESVFYIWFLRQIPHAAAEEFKVLKASKSWNEYLEEARTVVEQNKLPKVYNGHHMLNSLK